MLGSIQSLQLCVDLRLPGADKPFGAESWTPTSLQECGKVLLHDLFRDCFSDLF